MKSFEYARPTTEAEAVAFLGAEGLQTAILAGGTDLTSLLRDELLTPARVVDLKQIPSFRTITPLDNGIQIGALCTLDELAKSPQLGHYRSLFDVIDGIRAIQVQGCGTLGGDLCHLPNCWYFRKGYGLLGMEQGVSLPETGDNRYHAILGNSGPAKFVNASRFAPALIAWGAKVRIIGQGAASGAGLSNGSAVVDAEWVPLEYFYSTPRTDRQGHTILRPGQMISHVWLPESPLMSSATYEVLQMEGLDWPLAAAGVCLQLEGGLVRDARIVMGHVAPVPWLVDDAAQVLIGHPLNEETAAAAAAIAVAQSTPLSMNEYKVQIACTAVKRALLKAAGKLT